MCEAGRIKHHLKHNLWRSESTVVFVGYQAEGTTGRALLDGTKSVKLFGETIDVRAEIVQLQGVSGHADQAGLLRWLKAFSPPPKQIFVVHGESSVCEEFAQLISQHCHTAAVAPNYGASWILNPLSQLNPGIPREQMKSSVKSAVPSGVFARLVASGQRLLEVIQHNRGGTNKDLAKFADQINNLCDKWDR